MQVFYVFFQLWGTDKSSHALTTFGNVYLWIYFVPFIAQMLDGLGVGGGLRALNAVIDLAPLVVATLYSAAFASVVLSFRRVRETS